MSKIAAVIFCSILSVALLGVWVFQRTMSGCTVSAVGARTEASSASAVGTRTEASSASTPNCKDCSGVWLYGDCFLRPRR